jgi:hypothetical protein
VTLLASSAGGVPPLALRWLSLPPGCTDSGTGNLTCRPQSTGEFTVAAELTDSVHQYVVASEIIVVEPAAESSRATASGPWSSTLAQGLIAGVVLGATVAALAVWVLASRSRKRN